MQPFNFQTTHDEAKAIQLQLKLANSRYLAGGTNLVDLMKLHVETPSQLVDISSLSENKIHDSGKVIEVGAMVSNSDLAQHPIITKHLPVLSQAILSGASVQLRNAATTGGNLLQRTRCSYFRDTACPCNKRDPGSGCGAITGVNRNLAILGTSTSCIASNPSDMNVALMMLETLIYVKGEGGNRTIPISEFYRLPGSTPQVETSLVTGELITKIEIPKHSWFAKSLYVKVRDRSSYAFALTSAAVAMDLHAGVMRDVRIALGGVGTVPWRAKEAEQILRGQKMSTEIFRQAARAALAGATPRPGNTFKVDLAQRTLVNALQKLGGVS